jgi:cytosine/adenosine deaminase-related metal-dependent hydrolase
MVTLNPAKQLRIDSRVGSLDVGKDADVVIWIASSAQHVRDRRAQRTSTASRTTTASQELARVDMVAKESATFGGRGGRARAAAPRHRAQSRSTSRASRIDVQTERIAARRGASPNARIVPVTGP